MKKYNAEISAGLFIRTYTLEMHTIYKQDIQEKLSLTDSIAHLSHLIFLRRKHFKHIKRIFNYLQEKLSKMQPLVVHLLPTSLSMEILGVIDLPNCYNLERNLLFYSAIH